MYVIKRPVERDARVKVSKFKEVVKKVVNNGRDPRFDHLSGKLRWGLFQKSYAFIKDMKRNEISALGK